jgi:hypothetical protein
LTTLFISGAWALPQLHGRRLPALAPWAVVGAMPVMAAVLVWWLVRREKRLGALVGLAAAALAFTGLVAAAANLGLDQYKAPRQIVREARAQNLHDDVRIACYQYFQPSLVFYCRREVAQLQDERQVSEFLRGPLQSYLLLPAAAWEKMQTQRTGSGILVARHYDLYRHCEVVFVTNSLFNSAGACAAEAPFACRTAEDSH